MRILLTGGGTAGHINPAIAIADIIKQNCHTATIAFAGTPHGMENKLVKEAGYPMYHVNVAGFSRSFTLRNIRALWLALVSPKQAEKILADFRPDLVIGTGGYVSWPVLQAAAKQGIPTALHESNAVPGLTAKRLAPHMDAIWLNFKETANLLPKGCVPPLHTGNPLRNGFSVADRAQSRNRLGLTDEDIFLLSFGGSLGAEALNLAMLDFMFRVAPTIPQLVCLHACGEKHYDACRTTFDDTKRAKLIPYIKKMETYMSAADIVVCRAGAMTISELALCGKCAILVPSPYVANDHQRKNAMVLSENNASFWVEECNLPTNKLENLIKSLVFEKEKREKCQNLIKKFARGDTNRLIWQQIQLIARKRGADAP